MLRALFFISILISFASAAEAKGSKFDIIDETTATLNWKARDPMIVLAFGFLTRDQKEDYAELAENLRKHNPGLPRIQTLNFATVDRIVDVLKNPNTVGFVLISHTFEVKELGTAIFVDAFRQPIPNEILSAATPSLRFFAFIGCHGREAIKQYQAQYEIERLPGKQKVFSTTKGLLTAGLLWMNGVKGALKELFTILNASDFSGGQDPQPAGNNLLLGVKDVVGELEPRLVYVNGSIVGIFRGERQGEFENLVYDIPGYKLREGKCQNIAIRPLDLTSGALADDYLLRQVNFGGNAIDDKVMFYEPPLHVGDDERPWQGKDPMEAMSDEQKLAIGRQVYDKNSRQQRQAMQMIIDSVRDKEWIDKNPSQWPFLGARFYSHCF